MPKRRRASLLLALLLIARPAMAGTPPLLDPARLPHGTAAAREDYLRFLLQPLPRVFALSPGGAWGWAALIDHDAAATEAAALALCARWGGEGCRVYARDLAVVWPGLEAAAQEVPPEPVAAGTGWMVVADHRFLWYGPGRARGAYLWAHGRAPDGGDSRGAPPEPHVRAFNNAGYDIFRLDRDPATDATEAAARWMREGLGALRRAGYPRLVAAGQSRGGWNALQVLAEPGLAEAVVAIVPAAHGPGESLARPWALDDLRRLVAAARSPGTRVAVVHFADDPFDPDPAARAAILEGLRPRSAALLLLDRPPDIRGHAGGAEWRFTLGYATCLLDFAEARRDGC